MPLAISTVTNQRLTDASATSVADIQRLVPSLQVSQGSSGQQDFIIRGSPGGFGSDPAVITYIDEVPIDSRTLVYTLFDLASVQELKGPQGTLFGRNSTGGAVLFFSKRPDTSAIGGYVSGRYANLNERRIEGAINLPLTNTLAVRVAGELDRRDGRIESSTVPGLDYGNRNNEAVRASALWTPDERIENYFQFTYYRQRENHMPQVLVGLAGPCTGPTTPAIACLFQPPFNAFLGTGNLAPFFAQQQALPSDRTVNNNPDTDNAERMAVTNSLTVRFGGVSVRNILYYGDSKILFTKDYDGTPVRVFDQNQTDRLKTFYTETQIFGKLFDDRLDWRVGGVYSNDKDHQTNITAVFPFPVSITQPRTAIASENFKSKALFGQVSYDFSDILKGVAFTAGYRHTWDDRSLNFQVFQGQPTTVCALQTLPVPASGPVPFSGTNLATCTRKLDLAFNDSNYNFTLDWKPSDKILLYATTRRGYKAGSFNLLSTGDALSTYAPETVNDIEIGLKTDFRVGGVPLRANISAFRAKYTNIQESIVDTSRGTISVLVVNQDPVTGRSNKATIQGFEVELTAKPVSWLTLSGFYSLVDAKYTQFIVPGNRLDLAGADVSGVIPETYGVSAQAKIPVSGRFGDLDATVSYYGTGAPLANLSVPTVAPRRESLDARLAVRDIFDTGAELAVFGKNITDVDRCTINNAIGGAPTCLRGEGRTYGVELTVRFGADRR